MRIISGEGLAARSETFGPDAPLTIGRLIAARPAPRWVGEPWAE
jgi:hypothetical protein